MQAARESSPGANSKYGGSRYVGAGIQRLGNVEGAFERFGAAAANILTLACPGPGAPACRAWGRGGRSPSRPSRAPMAAPAVAKKKAGSTVTGAHHSAVRYCSPSCPRTIRRHTTHPSHTHSLTHSLTHIHSAVEVCYRISAASHSPLLHHGAHPDGPRQKSDGLDLRSWPRLSPAQALIACARLAG